MAEVLLLQESPNPPFAISLTNHGAEHCIVLEDRWIVADEDVLQSVKGILSSRISSPVILLNACGSLRLGDSCVPKKYSVAAALAESGANVIGPMRIVPIFPGLASLFSTLILSGEPLGRIVNALNFHIEEAYGERGAYHLLGDPTFALGSDTVVALLPKEPKSYTQDICPVQKSVAALEACINLFEVLDRCGAWDAGSKAAMESVFEAHRTGVLSTRAKHAILDSPDSVTILKDYLDGAVSHFSTTLVDLVSTCIGAGQWIGSLYAQFSAERDGSWGACARCSDEAITIRFKPFGLGGGHFSRTECDRCGTTIDKIGNHVVDELISVNVTPTELEIFLPKRRVDGIARVLIHRGGLDKGVHWPEEGGIIAFPRDHLGIHGRVTIVALCVSGAELTALYHTIFVPKFLS
ncbi:hypothetical protein GE300_12865 [Rhodobacteraceae bacterium 2CG4]|uniref:Uncharacterized protein n=1 Tax=Halovulum marinum TaxID=2662447 RepID=A0A6L5Z348_9RHOB|nr:hypothetical protein [Halovulum marinum]MSU90500.1 hypothetical protein [Halovulum marinum]